MAEPDLDTADFYLSHDLEHRELSVQNISNKSSNEAVSSINKSEIIDLLSPSPPKAKQSSLTSLKCEQSSDKHMEVINLSDSENDMSPEHKEKAKELRLFLASIINEIH